MFLPAGITNIVIAAAVGLFACSVGAVCGMGGGVIIKPVLDAIGLADVATINFLSGATVLAMSFYSVGSSMAASRASKEGGGAPAEKLDPKIDTPLAIGAALGGLAGKELFSAVAGVFPNPDTAGAVQAATLTVITLGTLIYTLNKDRIATLHVTSVIGCVLIGLLLGGASAFLGIGGGPINLVVLFYFFSMRTKRAVGSSLYIILFAQATNIAALLWSQGVPMDSLSVLITMIVSGIVGGALGRKLRARMDDAAVDKLFIVLMLLIIAINVYNVWKFAAA